MTIILCHIMPYNKSIYIELHFQKVAESVCASDNYLSHASGCQLCHYQVIERTWIGQQQAWWVYWCCRQNNIQFWPNFFQRNRELSLPSPPEAAAAQQAPRPGQCHKHAYVDPSWAFVPLWQWYTVSLSTTSMVGWLIFFQESRIWGVTVNPDGLFPVPSQASVKAILDMFEALVIFIGRLTFFLSFFFF